MSSGNELAWSFTVSMQQMFNLWKNWLKFLEKLEYEILQLNIYIQGISNKQQEMSFIILQMIP